jgi:CCR4-NOT transcription complex subunit 2
VLANGISPAPGSNAPRRRQTPSNGDQAGVTVQPPPHVLQQMQLQLQQHQQPPALPLEMPQSPVEQVMVSPADRFGLLGLLHLIKHANAGQSLLSLGSDLSKLGLELGRTGFV